MAADCQLRLRYKIFSSPGGKGPNVDGRIPAGLGKLGANSVSLRRPERDRFSCPLPRGEGLVLPARREDSLCRCTNGMDHSSGCYAIRTGVETCRRSLGISSQSVVHVRWPGVATTSPELFLPSRLRRLPKHRPRISLLRRGPGALFASCWTTAVTLVLSS